VIRILIILGGYSSTVSNIVKLRYDIWSVSRYGQITMLSLEGSFLLVPSDHLNETELKS
jgi:hypothetical protein